MENTGKKGRKWLGVRNWGRQLGECQWADTRGILQTVAGSRGAQGEAAKPVPPKWGPAGQGPAPRGAERSEGSAQGVAGGGAWSQNPRASKGSLSLACAPATGLWGLFNCRVSLRASAQLSVPTCCQIPHSTHGRWDNGPQRRPRSNSWKL